MKTSFIPLSFINKPTGVSYLVYLCLFIITLSSCSKDDFTPDLEKSVGWEPQIAFPLAYTEIGIAELANINDSSTTMEVDNDQFCTLIYQDQIFELKAEQLLQVPDQSLQSQFSLNNSEILTFQNSGQVQVTHSEEIVFSVSQGVEIDSMLLKNTLWVIECNSTFPANSEVRLTIPGLKKDGIIFSQNILLNYNGSPLTHNFISIPLHNYKMDMTKNGTTTNTMELNYTITLTGNGSNVTGSNSIECSATFRQVNYQIMFGYIGQQNIANVPDSVQLSIFNNALGLGSFTIAEPVMSFDISNSLGVPFDASISQLTALNFNQTNFAVATGIPDPLPITSPSITQIGQTMYNSFSLTNSNSNINALINEKPAYLVAQSQVTTNPSGPGTNFITDSSRLAVTLRVELPLNGTANDFRIRDTIPFNYNDLENVSNMTLRMNIENWFPIETGLQLIFTDENFYPLDTLFVPGEVVIPSGVITAGTERVTIAGRKIHDHIFDSMRINKILTAKNILVEAAASTLHPTTTNVKIFNDYKLKLKIGAIVKLKIQ